MNDFYHDIDISINLNLFKKQYPDIYDDEDLGKLVITKNGKWCVKDNEKKGLLPYFFLLK